MKKSTLILCAAAIILFETGTARADFHLELGLNYTPTFISDDAYEFFSDNAMTMNSLGLDLRVEAGEIGALHFLPFVSWRFDANGNEIPFESDLLFTDLAVNDLYGGLRLKGWFLPWLGAYGQIGAGVSFIDMDAHINSGYEGMLTSYNDEKTKFLITGMIGAEMRISPAVLKKHGVTRFNFGGEFGVGYIKRATTNFQSTAQGGDDYSLPSNNEVNFGEVNLSGWCLQLGLTFHFL